MQLLTPLNEAHLGQLKLEDYLRSKGISRMKYRVEASELVLKEEVKKSKGSYLFDIREGNGNTDKLGEIRLSHGDRFFVTSIGLGLLKEDIKGVNGVAKTSNTPIIHFPNQSIFNGVENGLRESECLEVVYGHGGGLELKENGEIIFEKLPTAPFRASPTGPIAIYPKYAVGRDSQFTLKMAPGVRDYIEGETKRAIDPAADPVVYEDTGKRNFIVLQLRGYLIKGIDK